ncbi:DNA-binding transcriptional regulator, MerR family [Trichococcus ilyis]|uniref:DNA-binding transcriptional regulator, MerR family n=2 Tax=Trichococcus ilyis TaxID=640938 RepID=A0A143Z3T0_9LACT|nr:merr bacterial regulatory protein hth signature [Trichococcus ilyis]SEJ64026.1 DNA-binding transcriptional regulator, MerR family [Trichococcus ilyis]
MMNIKKASEETGVSADTIRYYERIGLIPPIKRNENGVREFDEEDLRWIVFSRQMRNAGLSIEALIEYLTLFRSGEETVSARVDLLIEQQNELQERIDVMQQALDRLKYKISNYDSHMVPSENKLRDFDENKA